MLASKLTSFGGGKRAAHVVLQNQLVPLLSDQLYRSPIKAIEELVVNSYDARATTCKLYVPSPTQMSDLSGDQSFIVVFDDGEGMGLDELERLWDVGRSPKTLTRKVGDRKQIGKFGIGKLATYAVAYRLTYFTKTDAGIFASSLNYHDLETEGDSGGAEPKRAPAPISSVDNWERLHNDSDFQKVVLAAGVAADDLKQDSWTLAILEELKDKAKDIKQGRLKWVLRTAMPLRSDFSLYLNGQQITSSKSELESVVEFDVSELPQDRIDGLNKATGEEWRKAGDKLVSKSFPSGVTGSVMMTKRNLTGGKSDDLERSHGFFVRVLGRLVNLEDANFGTKELSYKYFHRVRVDVNADDLDSVVVAARDGVELSELRKQMARLLRELFNEARSRYNELTKKTAEKQRGKKEDDREYVSPRFVEHPLADVLTSPSQLSQGSEADHSWFYLEVPKGTDVKELAKSLYGEKRKGYNFRYVGGGRRERLVKFNPAEATFVINTNHEFVQKHQELESQNCLEDFVIAETLLEVYLREEGVTAANTGEILERRDELLRSLACDQLQSPNRIAQFLEDSSENEYDLEIGLVVAARALGFTAKHLSGPDQADGVAAWVDHPYGVKRITLEAKASANVPSLAAIDFAGLKTHVEDMEGATGCLLLAPRYPGSSKEDDARAAKNAKSCKISCWTIQDLANIVRHSQSLRISAEDVLDIVHKRFSPDDVAAGVQALLSAHTWSRPDLLAAIVRALRNLENKLPDTPRSVEMVSTTLALEAEFGSISESEVEAAVAELAAGSQGTLRITPDGKIRMLASLEEVERRARSLISKRPNDRKPGEFRSKNEEGTGNTG